MDTNKFINPLSSACMASTEPSRYSFYNCVLKEFSLNKWVCYGPFDKPEEATMLSNIEKNIIVPYNKSVLIISSSYLPDKLGITRSLVADTFPVVKIVNPNSNK